MGKLKDRVSIITGGGRGIGRAIALRFAQEGSHVVIAARTHAEINKVVEEIALLGVSSLAIPTDISDPYQGENLIKKTFEKFGRIDILVNNAGKGLNLELLNSDINDMKRVLDTNLMGIIICTKAVLPIMMKQRQGVIINISSIAGKMGMINHTAYCASKFGVIGFTESLFEEVREYNIKVSVICPGTVDTSFISRRAQLDEEKLIKPEDVAEVALMIASSSDSCCVTEVMIKPQRDPYRR